MLETAHIACRLYNDVLQADVFPSWCLANLRWSRPRARTVADYMYSDGRTGE